MAAGRLSWKQLLVLRLRARGMSVSEIARRLGVTRQDVSASLRRAERSYREALETLEAYVAASSPVVVEAGEGSTVEDVAEALLREADRAGVKLALGRGELASCLRAVLRGAVVHGRLRERVCLAVSPEGVPLRVDCGLLDALAEEAPLP